MPYAGIWFHPWIAANIHFYRQILGCCQLTRDYLCSIQWQLQQGGKQHGQNVTHILHVAFRSCSSWTRKTCSFYYSNQPVDLDAQHAFIHSEFHSFFPPPPKSAVLHLHLFLSSCLQTSAVFIEDANTVVLSVAHVLSSRLGIIIRWLYFFHINIKLAVPVNSAWCPLIGFRHPLGSNLLCC